MEKNHWFKLPNVGKASNGVRFSCLFDENHCFIKYNILDLNFEIEAEMKWFGYSWRRREGEEISYIRSSKKVIITFDEIINIPYFKKLIHDRGINKPNGRDIEIIIQNDIDIKRALIERYAIQLGDQLYKKVQQGESLCIEYERFCGCNNILKKLQEMYKEDDFSQINELSDCIINCY